MQVMFAQIDFITNDMLFPFSFPLDRLDNNVCAIPQMDGKRHTQIKTARHVPAFSNLWKNFAS